MYNQLFFQDSHIKAEVSMWLTALENLFFQYFHLSASALFCKEESKTAFCEKETK